MPISDSYDPATHGVDIGVVGRPGRATVTEWGSVLRWSRSGDAPPLDWFIAAEDRWHVPANETTVRQTRVDGTPVVETKVRVPNGDAVQRVYAVAEGDGLVVVEVENDSPMPFAVAFAGHSVLTERPPSDVPIEGIDLPDDTTVLPVGHQTTVRIAFRLDPDGHQPGRLPKRLPGVLSVVRGWTSTCERASRLLLPDDTLTAAVVAARCDLLLAGPVPVTADPVGFVLDAAELVRLGDPAEQWLVEVAGVIEQLAPRRRRKVEVSTEEFAEAVRAAASIAAVAGDDVAYGDAVRMLAELSPVSSRRNSGEQANDFSESEGRAVARYITSVERRLADGSDLLAGGIPPSWFGANFEVHNVPTGPKSAVSYAIRWHGARPALLWEQSGVQQHLTASSVDPEWSSTAVAGETLLAAPPRSTQGPATTDAAPSAVETTGPDVDGGSGAAPPGDGASFS